MKHRRIGCGRGCLLRRCSIHPQGWVPIETRRHKRRDNGHERFRRSIHPQGWVPIETRSNSATPSRATICSIHPQGWVPIETGFHSIRRDPPRMSGVAFTPKGGCPLKHRRQTMRDFLTKWYRSIHPQGWVPIETRSSRGTPARRYRCKCSIHPQGWVPIETSAGTLYLAH